MADPYDDFEAKEWEDALWLESRPKCDWCGEPIQEENCYRIFDDLVCEKCVSECWISTPERR